VKLTAKTKMNTCQSDLLEICSDICSPAYKLCYNR